MEARNQELVISSSEPGKPRTCTHLSTLTHMYMHCDTLNVCFCLQTLEVNDSEDIYVVNKIVDTRVTAGVTEYHVQWQGYKDQDTWEAVGNLVGRADAAIRDFVMTMPAGEAPARKKRPLDE